MCLVQRINGPKSEPPFPAAAHMHTTVNQEMSLKGACRQLEECSIVEFTLVYWSIESFAILIFLGQRGAFYFIFLFFLTHATGKLTSVRRRYYCGHQAEKEKRFVCVFLLPSISFLFSEDIVWLRAVSR